MNSHWSILQFRSNLSNQYFNQSKLSNSIFSTFAIDFFFIFSNFKKRFSVKIMTQLFRIVDKIFFRIIFQFNNNSTFSSRFRKNIEKNFKKLKIIAWKKFINDYIMKIFHKYQTQNDVNKHFRNSIKNDFRFFIMNH